MKKLLWLLLLPLFFAATPASTDAVGCVGSAASSVAATGGASAVPNPLFGGLPTASVYGIGAGVQASVSTAISGL